MVADTLPDQNCVVMETNSSYATVKKSPESDRRRRKQKKIKASEEPWPKTAEDANKNNDPNHVAEQFEIEYLPEKVELDEEEGMDEEFRRIFAKFSFSDVAGSKDTGGMLKADSDSEEEDEVKEKRISNKKKKVQRRMKIAELKQICSRPDVVEVWDATASDPKLLVFLKSCRNTVPVPRHWSRKRKFLQGKIGIEKEPFQLPDFVAATGIEKIRLKQKQRGPSKLGRMEIDYKVLHDAFFKYQRKPKLSSVGEVYHEGKEFEVNLREMKLKGGVLSHELKEALGMPEGDELTPPWLINMQRYGPPPSYPNYEKEAFDNTKHWGDLMEEEEEEEEEEEQMEEEELEVIELRKQQRKVWKEPEWPLYQVVL